MTEDDVVDDSCLMQMRIKTKDESSLRQSGRFGIPTISDVNNGIFDRVAPSCVWICVDLE